MKAQKILVGIVPLVLTMFFFLYSCNKNTDRPLKIEANTDSSPIKRIAVSKSVSDNIVKWQYKNMGYLITFKLKNNGPIAINDVTAPPTQDPITIFPTLGVVNFDYTNVTSAAIGSDTVLIARAVGSDASTQAGYFVAFYTSNNNTQVNSTCLMRIDSISPNIIHVNYFNEDQLLLLTEEINSETQSATNIYVYNELAISSIKTASTKTTMGSFNCGQAVANCLADVYTNHGWVSVWAWVQTAYLPHTAALMAVACYLHDCPHSSIVVAPPPIIVPLDTIPAVPVP